jgi:hypothetical protein
MTTQAPTEMTANDRLVIANFELEAARSAMDGASAAVDAAREAAVMDDSRAARSALIRSKRALAAAQERVYDCVAHVRGLAKAANAEAAAEGAARLRADELERQRRADERRTYLEQIRARVAAISEIDELLREMRARGLGGIRSRHLDEMLAAAQSLLAMWSWSRPQAMHEGEQQP